MGSLNFDLKFNVDKSIGSVISALLISFEPAFFFIHIHEEKKIKHSPVNFCFHKKISCDLLYFGSWLNCFHPFTTTVHFDTKVNIEMRYKLFKILVLEVVKIWKLVDIR